MNINLKKQNGITLIATIITIIVIVILFGIIIAVTIKDDGIVSKADLAKIKQEEAGMTETISSYYNYSEDGSGIDIAKTHENLKKMDKAKLEPKELEEGATSFTVRIKGKYKEYKYLIENGVPQNLELFDFAIKANFEDAIIKINEEEISTVKASGGEQLNWSVSKEGYITQSGTYTMGEYPHTMDITLVQPVFKISTTQTGLTIKINDEERTELQAPVGTVINWSVEKEGFEPQSGTYTLVESDYTKSIKLREYCTFTINVISPAAATVMIDGEAKKSCIVASGDSVKYEVSCAGYNTKSATYTVSKTVTVDVELSKTITVYLNKASSYSGLCNGGSASRSLSSISDSNLHTYIWGYGDFDRSVLQNLSGRVSSSYFGLTATTSVTRGNENWKFYLNSGNYSTSTGETGTSVGKSVDKITNTSDTVTTNFTMDQLNKGIYVYMTTTCKKSLLDVPSRTVTLSNIRLVITYYPDNE